MRICVSNLHLCMIFGGTVVSIYHLWERNECEYISPNRPPNLWSRVFHEKLIASHVIKKILAFYDTRNFLCRVHSSRPLVLILC
jgi:hypothetical protein